jgi:hypothetical protein
LATEVVIILGEELAAETDHLIIKVQKSDMTVNSVTRFEFNLITLTGFGPVAIHCTTYCVYSFNFGNGIFLYHSNGAGIAQVFTGSAGTSNIHTILPLNGNFHILGTASGIGDRSTAK